MVGGPCGYRAEPGTITVKKISKYPPSDDKNSSPASAEVIIEYEFAFDVVTNKGKIRDGEVAVTPEQARAKGVEAGKKYRASMGFLVSGTCNPEPLGPSFEEWK